MKALFRPDSGAGSGLGHVQRCLALAAALAERGVECSFAVPELDSVRERIERAGFAGVELETGLPAVPGELLVVDSYHVDAAYLRELQDAALTVVLIDDHAAFPVSCALCVNAGANAESLPYRSESSDTRFLVGPGYALLPPELWDTAPRPPAERVANVLLTLGGSDPHDLAPRLLLALDALDADFSLTVVVGPYFSNCEQLTGHHGRDVTLLDAPASLVEPMRAADLAVSAAGQTLYALARLGVPTVALELADNQRGGLAALEHAGAVRVAGRAGEPGLPDAVAAAVRELVADDAARHGLAHTAGSLLDGQGARRVAAEIVRLGASTGIETRR
jgi:UDP-2,4-diacetamido-2,4,6-trideoxy-beta-L-altropyranose hydrolase